MTAKQGKMLERLKRDHLDPASTWLWARLDLSMEWPLGHLPMAWSPLT